MNNEIVVTMAPEFEFSMDEFVDWLEDLDADEILFSVRGINPLYAYFDDALDEDQCFIMEREFAYILRDNPQVPVWVLRGKPFAILDQLAKCDDYPETAGEWLAAIKKEGLA